MAHVTVILGAYSELVAEMALLANGYVVSRTRTVEPFDMKAEDPITGEEFKVQVKTIRKRSDRDNQMVVYATNGRGRPYSQTDVDFFIGVLAEEGEVPRVWMFENRGICEYWASEASAAKRWAELPITFDRSRFELEAVI